ncbi:MAG TPA: pyridoxal-phosphate dependent enzyme [Firmicutes bacterium]|nr:pyridoxal-phosphate dependent enzyme [Bacillota bacterium]
MGRIIGLKCVRCGKIYGTELGPKAFEGCPVCAQEGQPANLSTVYDYSGLNADDLVRAFSQRPRTMWRYIEMLPADNVDEVVSLHEGCTPLMRLHKLEEEYGIGRLYIKDESRNPTGSFKDRLASCAVTRGLKTGARVITVSSTGNHGSSTAAYATRADLDCIVFTMDSVPLMMKVLMQVYGGKLVACKNGPDRWKLMAWGVREKGWYPLGNYVNPPVGSNPYGVDGYKSMALEICEDLGWKVPDVVIQPTAYGDGLYGMWKGFAEMKQLGIIDSTPRMYAAEVFGPLCNALAKGGKLEPVAAGPSVAFSIASPFGTHQALRALVDSRGGAISVSDEEILAVQERLGKHGLYAEASSCASVAAAIRLAKKGVIGKSDTVVAVITATGQRDPWVTQSRLPAVPVVEPDPDHLSDVLKTTYGFVV